MQSIFSNALSSAVAKHIDRSVTRRETLSWLALLIMQHGTISLWRLAAYVASATPIASVRRRFYRFFHFVQIDGALDDLNLERDRPLGRLRISESHLAVATVMGHWDEVASTSRRTVKMLWPTRSSRRITLSPASAFCALRSTAKLRRCCPICASRTV
jgi:hypothetical protein